MICAITVNVQQQSKGRKLILRPLSQIFTTFEISFSLAKFHSVILLLPYDVKTNLETNHSIKLFNIAHKATYTRSGLHCDLAPKH